MNTPTIQTMTSLTPEESEVFHAVCAAMATGAGQVLSARNATISLLRHEIKTLKAQLKAQLKALQAEKERAESLILLLEERAKKELCAESHTAPDPNA